MPGRGAPGDLHARWLAAGCDGHGCSFFGQSSAALPGVMIADGPGLTFADAKAFSDFAEASATGAIRRRPSPLGSRISTATHVSTFLRGRALRSTPARDADVRFIRALHCRAGIPDRDEPTRNEPVQRAPNRLVRANLEGAVQLGPDSILSAGEVPAANQTVSGARVRSTMIPTSRMFGVNVAHERAISRGAIITPITIQHL